jgi:hypothetical protein
MLAEPERFNDLPEIFELFHCVCAMDSDHQNPELRKGIFRLSVACVDVGIYGFAVY